jgi:hypothetical protein
MAYISKQHSCALNERVLHPLSHELVARGGVLENKVVAVTIGLLFQHLYTYLNVKGGIKYKK